MSFQDTVAFMKFLNGMYIEVEALKKQVDSVYFVHFDGI